MEIFHQNKSKISYHDPFFSNYKFSFVNKKISSVTLNKKNILAFDIIVISTDHDKINYKLIYDNAKIILDTRGKYQSLKNDKIISA